MLKLAAPLAVLSPLLVTVPVAQEAVAAPSLRVLELEGTPHARGLKHGTELRQEIATLITSWKADIERTHGVDADEFVARFLAETDFIPAIEKWTPGLMDEVRGIAEGAGVEFSTMLAYQLPDEMWALGNTISGDHCTGIGVDARGDEPAIVGQNLDVPRWYHVQPTVLRIRDAERDHEALVVTIPGLVGANGLNSRRVGVTVNTILQLRASRTGLPVAFVVRGILACESHAAALEFVRTIEHASGQNYIVGGPTEVLELAVTGRQLQGPTLAENLDARDTLLIFLRHLG